MSKATAAPDGRQGRQGVQKRRVILPSWEEMERALIVLGYREGAPPQVSILSRQIDRELCDFLTCRACGCVGLVYHPWHQRGSYFAFGECRSCGKADEV